MDEARGAERMGDTRSMYLTNTTHSRHGAPPSHLPSQPPRLRDTGSVYVTHTIHRQARCTPKSLAVWMKHAGLNTPFLDDASIEGAAQSINQSRMRGLELKINQSRMGVFFKQTVMDSRRVWHTAPEGTGCKIRLKSMMKRFFIARVAVLTVHST